MERISTFMSPVSCSDISVTSGGLILIAAFENGLRVFNFAGQELGGWRTAGNMKGDEVLAVDAYGNDAVVSLKKFHEVVRLQSGLRPIDRWHDLGLVATLRSPIVRQSVCVDTDMMAISTEYPRTEIRLYRISRPQFIALLPLVYRVHNVTLTDKLVVVAGSMSKEDGEIFFIEATSLKRMSPVWRRPCKAFAFDICFSLLKKCLYVAENESLLSLGLQKRKSYAEQLMLNLSQQPVQSLRRPLRIAQDDCWGVPVIVLVGDDSRTVGAFRYDNA